MATLGATGATPAARKWLYAESPHFVMLNGAYREDAQNILKDLESFHDALDTLFGHPALVRKRTTIVVFRFVTEVGDYWPGAVGEGSQVVAFSVNPPDECLLAMSNDNQAASVARRIIYQQYAMHYLRVAQLKLPYWLLQGLGDFYSSAEIRRDRISFGQSIHEYRNELTRYARSLPSLKWVFGMTPQSPNMGNGRMQESFRATAWAVVNYWMCSRDPTNLQKFLRFMTLIEKPGADSATCMQEAFGMNEAAMEKAVFEYIKDGRYVVRNVPRSKESAAANYKVRPATEFERDFILADLRCRSLRNGTGEAQLAELAEKYGQSPLPWEVLGSAAAEAKDLANANRYWDEAVARGSENPYVYSLRAAAKFPVVEDKDSLDFRLGEDQVKPLAEDLRKAIALNPNDDQSVELLCFLASIAAQPDPADINLCQRRFRHLRDKRNVMLSLAVLMWRMGDEMNCRTLLDRLTGDSALPASLQVRAKELERRLDSGISAGGAVSG